MTGDGDLDNDGSTGNDEKWLDFRCILKGESTGFIDELDMRCGSKVFGQSNLEVEIAIN